MRNPASATIAHEAAGSLPNSRRVGVPVSGFLACFARFGCTMTREIPTDPRNQRVDHNPLFGLRQGADMRTMTSYAGRSLVLAAVLGVAASWAGGALAAEPEKSSSNGSSAPTEKKIRFTMTGKPWKDVTEWFADHTGLSFVGKEY